MSSQSRRTSLFLCALFLLVSLIVCLGCGSNSSPNPATPNPNPATPNPNPANPEPPPPSVSSQLIYLTAGSFETRLYGFQIQNDGTLTTLDLASFTFPFWGPEAPGITSAGPVLYVPSDGITALSVDLQSGQLSPLPGSPFPQLSAVGASPTACGQNFLYVTSNNLAEIFGFEITSGGALHELPQTQLVGPVGSSPVPAAAVVDPSCRFLFVPSGNGISETQDGFIFAYTIDANSGILNAAPGSPFGLGTPSFFGTGLEGTTDVYGNFLYVPLWGSQGLAAFSVDMDAALTPVPGSPFATGTFPESPVVVTVGSQQFLYLANVLSSEGAITAFAIDSETGVLTHISDYSAESGIGLLVSSGNFLYNLGNDVGYAVNQDGTLTPFATGVSSYVAGSATVPLVYK